MLFLKRSIALLLMIVCVLLTFTVQVESETVSSNTVISSLNDSFQSVHEYVGLQKNQKNISETIGSDTNLGKHVDLFLPLNSVSQLNAMLFQASQQSYPLYWLTVQFYPPDLSLARLQHSEKSTDQEPWFLQASLNNGARMAGWKDSNLLYTARITYH